jgi:(p)ppGpp synthase/HD superfamily hydrolase
VNYNVGDTRGSWVHAYLFSQTAHDGQFDKSGKKYFLHPLAVASMTSDDDERVVALLHDVIEDTEFTADDLAEEGFSHHIIEAVVAMSHIKGEKYKDYITRVSKNPLARAVKLLDLKHNMDWTRLNKLTKYDIERTKKYHKAYLRLLND